MKAVLREIWAETGMKDPQHRLKLELSFIPCLHHTANQTSLPPLLCILMVSRNLYVTWQLSFSLGWHPPNQTAMCANIKTLSTTQESRISMTIETHRAASISPEAVISEQYWSMNDLWNMYTIPHTEGTSSRPLWGKQTLNSNVSCWNLIRWVCVNAPQQASGGQPNRDKVVILWRALNKALVINEQNK